MWWLISIGVRPMPSVVFSPRTSSSCMGRKRSGTIPSQTPRSVSTCCARQRPAPCRLSSSHGQRQPTADQQRSRMRSQGTGAAFQDGGRIVIVGASLAGLSPAQTLRADGVPGPLTLIGDEPYLPYDRPPLSKAVLTGWIPAEHTMLPQREILADVEWRLGVAAVGLELAAKRVRPARGHSVAVEPSPLATRPAGRPRSHPAGAAL